MHMRTFLVFGAAGWALFSAGCAGPAVPRLDGPSAREAVLEAMAALSASMREDGGGPDAYAALLTEDFTRWNVRADRILTRDELLDGIRSWWEGGGRVTASDVQLHEIVFAGEAATTRLVARETYADGSKSAAAVGQLWVRVGDRWRLRRANVHMLEN